MPAPFLCYLRVYEPVRAFRGEAGRLVRAALARGALPVEQAGERDRELCLRAQLGVPSRLLPFERVDGTPLAQAPVDVLVAESGSVGPETLVCPLDTRPRAAAALVGFLATEAPLVRAAALGSVELGEMAIRARAEAVVAELGAGATHMVSATWTVPLPWFALVDPATRVLALPPAGARRVYWRVPMVTARRRAEQAQAVVAAALGEQGPAAVLRDTGRWLAHFDAGSLVELDYGGLVVLLDDDALRADCSAQDVHAAMAAMRRGDGDAAAVCYQRLREFWSEVASRERYN